MEAPSSILMEGGRMLSYRRNQRVEGRRKIPEK
jgi:hypothetical protein